MNESFVVLRGWVGTDVELRDAGGHPRASFRLACTPRFRRDGEWVNGETSWFTVTAWRTLAENVAASVRQGDAVLVHGRVRVETWQPDGEAARTSWALEASHIGHDLTRGTSTFTRATRAADQDSAEQRVEAATSGATRSQPAA